VILLSLTGAAIPEWKIDLAARTSEPNGTGDADGARPMVRIVAPAQGFIMAAAGRDRFETLEANGLLQVEGERQLADDFLSDLLVV
jgi:hypothetical protein